MQTIKTITASLILTVVPFILFGCHRASVKKYPDKVYYGYQIRKDHDSTWLRIYVYSLDTSYVVRKKNNYNIP